MLCATLQTLHLHGALAAVLNAAEVRGQLAGFARKESRAGSLPVLCLLPGLCVVDVCSRFYTCLHVCTQGQFSCQTRLPAAPMFQRQRQGMLCCKMQV